MSAHSRRALRWLVPGFGLTIAVVLLLEFHKGSTKPSEMPPSGELPETRSISHMESLTAAEELVSVSVVKVATPLQPKTRVERTAEKLEPRKDEWDTEILSDAVARQLEALSAVLKTPNEIDLQKVSQLVTEDFACQRLRPMRLGRVFDDGIIAVHRWDTAPEPDQAKGLRGSHALLTALQHFRNSPQDHEDFRVDLKLFKIEKEESNFSTRVFLEASRRDREDGRQQNATWRCQWTYPSPGTSEPPRLMRIELERYEEIIFKDKSGRLFADYTESVMGPNTAYAQQILPGINDWLPRISQVLDLSFLGHHGLAVGDVNGDGLDDLYVCDTGGLPNRLYTQNLDGTVSEVSAQAGVDWLDYSSAALLIDLDNDGDQDLVVALTRALLFLENDGSARFKRRASQATVHDAYSLSAADYDGDGDLDVYACRYGESDSHSLPAPVPYYDANNGGANVLLGNQGDFQFVDVTEEVGLDVNNRRYSFAAAWEDFDNDRDLDLYVANDFGRNTLYRNDGGRFTDVAGEAQVEDIASGMSASWGDFNRDGWMDLYVGNMFSAAGNRISYQRKFAGGDSAETTAQLRRMARGNTLFANAGDGRFIDVSESSSVTMGRWAWASKFADLNNDGWLDLAVANGYVTNEDSGDL